ncbi:hypothetical protein [Bradyrhizobium elkanii]|uniref:hypothetical protein n=1 Tax=Bradyrhizobium elkanii TaxID=29448 RepID=UPI00084134CB|nr:hypothetical protein [Bradyrhizobium elkanii]ODM71726.1 hypothetical protein A6X20_07230 [Bradyrhizobium elkanii]ODM79099.1 hypothetical protein A6452_28815 [Bradyrhizobium elkanii]
MTFRLFVNSNGLLCLEEKGDRFIRTAAAREGVTFKLQLHTNRGWDTRGEFTDGFTARDEYKRARERNPYFSWQLVAEREDCKALKLPARYDAWSGM